MPKVIARSLGILDVMILMIGVAIAAAFTRLYLVNNYVSFFSRLHDTPTNVVYLRWIMSETADFSCLWLTALTPVAFFIRLRRPRPVRVRLLRQPGATALFAVTVIVILGSILTAVAVAIEGNGPWFYYYQVYLIRLFPYAGAAVAVVWALQVLGGRWKPEASAIDRLGRLLGICWIATFLAGTSAMLQEGAWSSKEVSERGELLESTREDIEGRRVERLTRRQKLLEGSLQEVKAKESEHKKLIEAGDRERWKAEFQKQLQSLDQEKQIIREDLDELEKKVSGTSSQAGSQTRPVVPGPN